MALGNIRKRNKQAGPAKLQITSMMDMFTIILIFLLFSFSENPETMDLDKNVQLPESTAKQNYKENIMLVLSEKALKLEGKTVAKIKNGKIVGLDPNHLKDSKLYSQLKLHRENIDQLEALRQKLPGSQEEDKNKAHILFLCDKRLSFKTINNVVKTAGMAGYPNFQFAVLGKEI